MVMVLLSVLILSLGITGWFALEQQEEQVMQRTLQRGEDLANFTTESLSYSVVGYDYHTIQLLLDELVKAEDILYAKVINTKGNTMGESGINTDEIERWLVFYKNIKFDGEVIGELTLALDNTTIINEFNQQRNNLISREALLILLIAIGEFIALSFVIVRPVSIISKALNENIDEHGLITNDIPYQSNDEFGRLSTQFNEMRHKLNDANEKLQSKVELANEEVRHQNTLLREQSIELQSANKTLEKLSITDKLTGLNNRHHFDEVLSTEFLFSSRYGEPLSLIMLDIDNFKLINDNYGHAAGDKVLVEFSSIIKSNLRLSDVVFRIGGEEFAVLCRHNDINASISIANKLCGILSSTQIEIDNTKLCVTASFGIMTMPCNLSKIDNVDDFYQFADIAMYHSKQSGRNQVTHFVDISDQENTTTLKKE